jgi:glycosyltransferase involved in cell wall biosynthesis
MEISVVLATYNRAARLSAALDSFSKLVMPADLDWELIVVDNNSTDMTRSVVEEFKQRSGLQVEYLFEGQQGRSCALNAGIKRAKGGVIAFTDDDIGLHPQWLANLYHVFGETGCSAAAGRVIPVWNHAKPDWLEMEDQLAIVRFEMGDEVKEIRIPPLGANCAFRREIFNKYGLFRTDLGVSGNRHTITCDDTEFGERLIRGGEKIVYRPSAIVYHPVDPARATKKYFLSWYYYNGRSVTRTIGLPGEGVFYFGVPRWLLRRCATDVMKWLSCFDQKQRFHRKLQMLRSMGTVVESHHLSRRRTAMARFQSAVTS